MTGMHMQYLILAISGYTVQVCIMTKYGNQFHVIISTLHVRTREKQNM